MPYGATKHKVDGSSPPDSFLNELIAWGKTAPADIFFPNSAPEIYSSVFGVLGPWRGPEHRRAVMLEVLRVLAGIESTWKWNKGIDKSSKKSKLSIDRAEAGAWQVSADSMDGHPELRSLVLARVGSTDAPAFRAAMMSDHPLAMEYIARLLRRTINANGPIVSKHLHRYLRVDAVDEFLDLLYPDVPARMGRFGEIVSPYRRINW